MKYRIEVKKGDDWTVSSDYSMAYDKAEIIKATRILRGILAYPVRVTIAATATSPALEVLDGDGHDDA